MEETARSNQFQTFAADVKATGLTETLSNQGPYTIFAPTDQAFAALPAGTREQLLKPENKDLLLQVMGYRVVPGK